MLTTPERSPDYYHIEPIAACRLSGRDLKENGIDMGLPDDQLVGVMLGGEVQLEIEGHFVSLHEEQTERLKQLLSDKFSFSDL